MSTATASKAVNQILAAFENGNLPQAIAYSTFTPPANIPAYRWTARNRALAFLQMTGDARGYQQWKEAGRNVKKGSKAIYILGPVMKKSKSKLLRIENPEDRRNSNRQYEMCRIPFNTRFPHGGHRRRAPAVRAA